MHDMAVHLDAVAFGHLDGAACSHPAHIVAAKVQRSEEHTSELQSLMRISYAVFCLKKKTCSTPRPSSTWSSRCRESIYLCFCCPVHFSSRHFRHLLYAI